jgi:demethylmenaquinone methyltransferase / 2-methoxy-6-polyprenyl-1,4-benzoquinol methylase
MRSFFEHVSDVFSKTAPHYDLMNDVMSFGLHHIWKRFFVHHLLQKLPGESSVVGLDMSCGTGDILMLLLQNWQKSSALKLTGCDPNTEMLQKALEKRTLDEAKAKGDLNFVCSAAEKTPFFSDFFDFYTVSFGLRNMADRHLALKEAYRIVKPGGCLGILEFSKPFVGEELYEFYLKTILPLVSAVVVHHTAAYEYLAESIQKFPTALCIQAEIAQAGFEDIHCFPLSFGIVSAFYAFKKSI